MNIQDKSSTYRWDIQGIRAIAVLAVVFFHISPKHLPGGFLGVDIFFVISGYLIMGFIWRDLQNGTFTLKNFYFRRIKRLFPALFVMVFLTSIGAYFYLMPIEITNYAKSLIATLLYISNFYFYTEAGYFDSGLEFAPLIHTWSLSVEEQFYLFIPIFLLIMFKSGRTKTLSILFTIALISIIASESLIYLDKNLAFYTLPSRFWQFIVGGMLSINTGKIKYKRSLTNRIVTTGVGIAGLLIIIDCFFGYSSKTTFPGLSAILPTLATLMVIFAGSNQGVVYRLLSLGVFRFFGNISYSFYLWHWPVIVFYKLAIEYEVFLEEKLIILILSIFLGYLSWRYVENWFGNFLFSRLKKPILITVAASFFFCLIGVFSLDGLTHRFKKEQIRYSEYINYNTDTFRAGKCFLTGEFNDFNLFSKSHCITHKPAMLNTVLIGDSHAAHWFAVLNKNKGANETISQVTSSGCYPTMAYQGAQRCTKLIHWAFESLTKEKRFDKIILSSRWKTSNISDLKSTIAFLSKNTNEIIILGPTVEYTAPLPRLLALKNKDIEIQKNRFYNKIKNIDDKMSATLSGLPRVKYISIFKAICPTESQCMTSTDKGVPIAFDYGHFTYEGAQAVLKIAGKI